jgi:hypothetical protein
MSELEDAFESLEAINTEQREEIRALRDEVQALGN